MTNSRYKPNLISEFTKEYIEYFEKYRIPITVEFTTCPDNLSQYCRDIWKNKKELEKVGARWIIETCDVCFEHNGGEYYIHVSIVQM